MSKFTDFLNFTKLMAIKSKNKILKMLKLKKYHNFSYFP